MTAEETKKKLIELRGRLKGFGQDHLIDSGNWLDQNDQKELLADLLSINFEEMCGHFQNSTAAAADDPGSVTNGHGDVPVKTIDDLMEPIEDDLCASVTRSSPDELKHYRETALKV
jgi:hypothetical protein